jgi:hypothetical protein
MSKVTLLRTATALLTVVLTIAPFLQALAEASNP